MTERLDATWPGQKKHRNLFGQLQGMDMGMSLSVAPGGFFSKANLAGPRVRAKLQIRPPNPCPETMGSAAPSQQERSDQAHERN